MNKNSKLLRTFGCYAFFAIVVAILLLKVVNLHRDGSTVTPGEYSIYPKNTAYVIDINNAKDVTCTSTDSVKELTRFIVEYRGEGVYRFIDLEQKNALSIVDGEVVMKTLDSVDHAQQEWYIERIGASQYFKITNKGEMKSLQTVSQNDKELNLGVEKYDSVDEFCFVFVR